MSNFIWTPAIDQIVPVLNVTFLMHRDESGLCQAHRVGIPEFSIINFIKEQLPEGGTFIDAGAHMGVYSVYLSDNFKEIYAFEPQRRTFHQLCGNLFVNDILTLPQSIKH